jgi:hypothetical protein
MSMDNNFELHVILINNQEFILPLRMSDYHNKTVIEFEDDETVSIEFYKDFKLLGETYKCYYRTDLNDSLVIRVTEDMKDYSYICIKKFKND